MSSAFENILGGNSSGSSTTSNLSQTIQGVNDLATNDLKNASDSIKSSVSQIGQQLDVLCQSVDNIKNRIKINDLKPELKKQVDDLQEYANSIKTIMQDINNLSSNSLNISVNIDQTKFQSDLDVMKLKVEELSNKVLSGLDFSDAFKSANSNIQSKITPVISQINSAIESMFNSNNFENITDKIKEITNGIDNLKNEMGNPVPVTFTQDAAKGLNVLLDMLSKVTTGTKETKDEVKGLQEHLKFSQLDSQLEPLKYAELSFRNLIGDLQGLSKSFNSSQDAVASFFNTIKNTNVDSDFVNETITKLYTQINGMPDAINSMRKAFDTKDNILGIMGKPEELAAAFKTFDEGVVAAISQTQKTINDALNKLPNESSILGAMDPIVSGYKKEIEQTVNFIQDILRDLNKVGNNDDATNNVKATLEQRIKDLQEFYNSVEDISQRKSQNFNNLLNEALDPNSKFGKQLDYQLGSRAYGDFAHSMGSTARGAHNIGDLSNAAGHHLDSGFKNVTLGQRLKTKSSVDLDDIGEKAKEIEKLSVVYSQAEANFKKAFEKAGSGKPEDVKEAQDRLKDLIKLSEQLSESATGFGGLIRIYNKKDMQELPDEVKKVIQAVDQEIKNIAHQNHNVFNLAELIDKDSADEATKNLRKLDDEVDELSNRFDKAQGKSQGLFKFLKDGVSDILSPLGTVGKVFGSIGLGAIPLSLGGLIKYGSGVIDQYNEVGSQIAESTRADFGMGNALDPAAARYRLVQQGTAYSKLTGGIIGMNEYNNSYNNLARNVGGQYGENDIDTLKDLNTLNDKTFGLSKLYNISDSTMAQAVNTFYKDLRMSASDAADTINKLTQTAISANVPVDKYVRLVSQLAAQYRNIGLTGNNAIDITANLMARGLNAEDAAQFAGDVGRGMTSMADNWGLTAFTGIMSGQAVNPFQAIAMAQNRFDANGNANPDWGRYMANNIDQWMGTIATMTGGDKGAEYSFLIKTLKDQGFSHKSAELATEAYIKGDKNQFADILSKGTAADQQLETQQQINDKLKTIGDQLTPLQKTLNDLTVAQRVLGDQMKSTFDSFFSSIEKTVNKLLKDLEGMTTKLVGALENLTNSPLWKNIVSPYVNSLESNPELTIPLTLGGMYVGKKLVKGGVNKAWEGVKGIFNPKSVKTEAKAAEEAAEVASKAAPDFLKIAKKGGKAAIITTALAGIAYGGYKLFGSGSGSSDSSESGANDSLYSTPSSSATDNEWSMRDDRMYQKVAQIHDTIITGSTGSGAGGAYGSYTPSNPYMYNGYGAYDSNVTTPNDVDKINKNVDKNKTIPKVDVDSFTDTDSLMEILGLSGLSLFGDKFVSKGITKVMDKTALKKAAEEAAKTAEKDVAKQMAGAEIQTVESSIINPKTGKPFLKNAATGEIIQEGTSALIKDLEKTAEKGLEKELVQGGLKLGGKAIGEAIGSVAVDAIFNYYDVAKHGIKGDLVGSDVGKATSGFLTDASFTLGGAAIGTAIFPGVGTLVGGLLGGILEFGVNQFTKDENGKGAIDQIKDDLTYGFTDRNPEEIELERMIKTGKSNDFMLQGFQNLGFTKEASQVMVDALTKHSEELKDMNDDEKFAWAERLAEMKSQGMNEIDAMNQLKQEMKDGTLKKHIDELKIAIADAAHVTKEQVDSASRDAIDNVDKVKNVSEGKHESGTEHKSFGDKFMDSLKSSIDPQGYLGINKNTWQNQMKEKAKQDAETRDKNVENQKFHILKDKEGHMLMLTKEQLEKYEKEAGERVDAAMKKSMDDFTKDPLSFLDPKKKKTETPNFMMANPNANKVTMWSETVFGTGDVKKDLERFNINNMPQTTYSYALPADILERIKKEQEETNKKAEEAKKKAEEEAAKEEEMRRNTELYQKATMDTQKDTLKALQDFLNKNFSAGLTVDGLYGPQTETALDNALSTGKLSEPLKGMGGKMLQYEAYVEEASRKYGVDANLIRAVIQQESSWNNFDVSTSGAQGLMQLMPDTARGLGLHVDSNWGKKVDSGKRTKDNKIIYKWEDVTHDDSVDERINPEKNIMAGTKYLSEMLDEFNGDWEKALAAYNAGPGNVKNGKWKSFSETSAYVPAVLNYYKKFSGTEYTPTTSPDTGSGTDDSGGAGTSYVDDGMKKWYGIDSAAVQKMMGSSGVFSMGTLSASALSKDALARMYQSSYTSGDSKATTNYLGMMKDLLNAGGDNVYSVNNQALAKQLRLSMDNTDKENAEKAGKQYYDKFGAYVKPDFSTIYKPYDSSAYNIPDGVTVSKDGKNVIIGINVGADSSDKHVADAKEAAKQIAQLFDSKGYNTKIQEMNGKIETLAEFLHSLAKEVGDNKAAQYR